MDKLAGVGGSRHAASGGAGSGRGGHAAPARQERPFLIVVLAENAAITIDDLRTHLLRFVPKWWLPDAIAFAAELPHGPTGKLHKDELRRRVADGVIVPVTAPTTSGQAALPSPTT